MSSTALTRPLVTSLIEDAVTAPSMHNAQPWRFIHVAEADTVELHGDPERGLPREDPEHRALHIGCGAALFGLRVAAAHRGLRAETRLLPDPGDAWHLADVRLTKADGVHEADEAGEADDGDSGSDLEPFHPALFRRHTSRFPFTDERVPAEILDGLSAAALLEGCRLVVPDPWHTDNVLELVHDSERFEASDEAVRAEIAAWTRTGGSDDAGHTGDADEQGPATEGIPSYAFGPRQYDVTSPVRDFDASRRDATRASTPFEKRPQIVLLGTADDTPESWLRAGQAMQRVLLQATLDGLSTSLLSQPLEWPELRSLVRDPESEPRFVQMVIRLGYGPEARPTPRRPVSEVLTVR